MYRLGLRTLIAWSGMNLRRQNRPSSALAWTARGLAALMCGALMCGAQHVSSAFALVQEHPTTMLVGVLILLYHAGAGLVFGWFYWQCGGAAALVAHTLADIAIAEVNARTLTTLFSPLLQQECQCDATTCRRKAG